MKFRIKYADQVVGVFILLALAIVVLALLFIAINQRWFVHNTLFKSSFSSANSISIGTGISLRGFEIGKISKMSLNEANQVDIEFYVYPEYLPKVTMNSVLELSTSPIGLGTSLIFHKGKSHQPLAEFDVVPALDSDKGKSLAYAGLIDMPKKDDTIARLLSGVNTLLENVNTTVVLLNDTLEGRKKGPVGETLDNFNGTLKSAWRAMDSFYATTDWLQSTYQPVGTKAGVMLDDVNTNLPVILGQLQETMKNVEEMTASIKDTNGLVPRLLGQDIEGLVPSMLGADNERLMGNVDNVVGDVRATMKNVDIIMTNLNTSLVQVQGILGGVSAEVPKISSMMTEARSAIISAQDVMQGLKNNPLLKGGIVEKPQQTSLFQSMRKEEF